MPCFILLTLLLSSTLSLVTATSTPTSSSSYSTASWSGWGNGIFNNRWTQSKAITASNVKTLTRKCFITYPFGISATPVVHGTSVYYPTWNGSIVSFDYTSCRTQWILNVTQIIYDFKMPTPDVVRAAFPVSRTSPQVGGDILYFGTLMHSLVVAVNRHTGKLLGLTQINQHPYTVVTMSPTYWKGTILVGTSSMEEATSLFFPDYKCCSSVGNTVALTFNKHTNKFTTKWAIPTLPPNSSWSGAGVWGSQPSIDPVRNQVFFATGNLFSFPSSFSHCINQTVDCLPTGVNQDSILAIDIPTGKLNWVKRTTSMDAWNGDCIQDPINQESCPTEPPGPDSDFAMAPTFVPRSVSGLRKDVVVVAQKNAILYAFEADTGKTVWMKSVSPTKHGANLRWGIAVDDQAAYYVLPSQEDFVPPYSSNVSTSLYGAASLRDGRVLWTRDATFGTNSIALNAPTVAGDLVFVANSAVVSSTGYFYNSSGSLVVLDRKTGVVVLERQLETVFQGGIAVVGDLVMFGTGYRSVYSGLGNDYLGNGSLHVWKISGGRDGQVEWSWEDGARHGKE